MSFWLVEGIIFRRDHEGVLLEELKGAFLGELKGVFLKKLVKEGV